MRLVPGLFQLDFSSSHIPCMARNVRSRKAGVGPRLAAVRAQLSGLCSAGKETACGNRSSFSMPQDSARDLVSLAASPM